MEHEEHHHQLNRKQGSNKQSAQLIFFQTKRNQEAILIIAKHCLLLRVLLEHLGRETYKNGYNTSVCDDVSIGIMIVLYT